MDYQVIWYLIVGILLIGYAILDGFDLGVGILHPLAKTDFEKRIIMNSIGPVWDGNEVWLVTAGGALFAAFPDVYATAFSGFYIPFMLLLVTLILRAVAIEFRGKEEMKWWRATWDWGFTLGSLGASFLFGLAIGNAVIGMKIGADKEYAGTLLDQINLYTIMTGLFNVILFTMHGAIFLLIKTEGKLQVRIRNWALNAFWVFIGAYILISGYTLYLKPEMTANFSFGLLKPAAGPMHPLIENNENIISVFAWVIVILNLLAILNIHRNLVKKRFLEAFISSALSIGALIGIFALGIFPNFLVSSLDPHYSLHIYNASSSEKTLRTMFYVALIGIPFVLSYTISIYWVYRGKTIIDENSY